jgi:hypothetical protein
MGTREESKRPVWSILAAALVTSGCSGMSHTHQRVLSGGAIGAADGRSVATGNRLLKE